MALTAPCAWAEKKEAGGKIDITADRLISDSAARYVEFTGNVKAVQGDTVITSDKLELFYKENKGKKEGKAGDAGQSVEKIVATGNVNIKMDDRTAMSEKAVYTTESKVLVLTGKGSRIGSGGNFITGQKITLRRTDNKITVEKGKSGRVQAVIHSSEKVFD